MSSSEHILIEGDDSDSDAETASSGEAQQHLHIVNHTHAVRTEMILFDGGWLSLREHRSNRPGESRMINLRYVDPEPHVTRHFAGRALTASAALAAAALAAAILALNSVALVVTIPAAILLLTASAVTFAICAYKTRKNVVFVTRHGRAPVISLMGTLGSFRSLRAALPRLIEAIDKAADDGPPGNERLRSEMREHYRLRECGALSETACAASTQRILDHFR